MAQRTPSGETLTMLGDLIARQQLSLKIIRESPDEFGSLEAPVMASIYVATLWKLRLSAK
jgi:hypothetical protein